MRYLEQLLDWFSDTPREIIFKADVLRRGIQVTDDLHVAGAAALPDPARRGRALPPPLPG
jgi:hypothetical protein